MNKPKIKRQWNNRTGTFFWYVVPSGISSIWTGGASFQAREWNRFAEMYCIQQNYKEQSKIPQ
jgi:hypothetical protein